MKANTHIISEVLKSATESLRHTSTTPKLDAEVMMAFVLGCTRTNLLIRNNEILKEREYSEFEKLLKCRLQSEPLAYIIQTKEFYGRDFTVNKNVLCPRPETELMIEKAIGIVADKLSFLDLGTGSGCIAVTIALELKKRNIEIVGHAVDISKEALDVARENAKKFLVAENINFFQSDWLSSVPRQQFDLIVCNPPYVVCGQGHSPELAFEPDSALYADNDGLAEIEKILSDIPPYLKPVSLFCMEIGSEQGQKVKKLSEDTFPTAEISLIQDLAGHDRLLTVKHGPQTSNSAK